jgi:hypothetical protein
MDNKTHRFSDTGPAYEDRLPLSWNVLDCEPDAVALSRLHENNEEILKVINALDEAQTELDESHDPLAQQVLKLDFKVNLLLDLVGQLLSTSLSLPEPVLLHLSAEGVQWLDSKTPPEKAQVNIELYLKPKFPRAVRLPAVVKSVTKVEGAYRMEVIFQNMAEPVEDLLEKIIFRHHRRSIALSRRKN